MEYLQTIIDHLGGNPYLVVLLGFFLILFFLPLSEELILFVGGSMAVAQGGAVWLPTLLCGIFGVIFTDYWFYIWAKFYGQRLVKRKFIRRVFPRKRRHFAMRFVRKYGAWSVFLARFLPGGPRNPIFITCGIFHMSQKKFLIASSIGAGLSAQISFWAGYFFYDNLPPIEVLLPKIQKLALEISVVVVVAIIVIYFIRRRIKKQKALRNKN